MKKGFTLFELIVVLAILVMVAGIVTWSIQGVQARTKKRQFKEDLIALTDAYRQYYRDTGGFPPDATNALTIATDDSHFFYNYLPPKFRASDGKIATPLGGNWSWDNNLGGSGGSDIGISVNLGTTGLPSGWKEVDQTLLSEVIEDMDGQTLADVQGGSETGRFREYDSDVILYLILEETS